MEIEEWQEAELTDPEQWAGNWIWRAVYMLAKASGTQTSMKWIAERLDISIENAVEAIEGLQRMNLLVRKSNGFQTCSQWVQIDPAEVGTSGVAEHDRIAQQITSRLTGTDIFSTQFMVGDQALVQKYAPRFKALYQEMYNEGLANGLQEVIASEISFVQLTRDGGSK